MSIEEETTQATGEEQVEVTEGEAQEESTEVTTSEKDETVDYKAIAEAEQKRRESAEKTAADLAFKLRDKRRESESTDESDDPDDAPLTRKELAEALKDFSQSSNEKNLQETQARQIIGKFTSNSDEANAAYIFWKNRVVPTGDLEEDIKFALGGLNYQRVIATNTELKRSLQSKDTKNRDGSTSYKDAPGSSEPKMNSADAQTIKASGMKWDITKQVYAKKLKDGKTFYFDPKTKKKWKA